ncbi:ammonia-dependent NAD(+) synthetase [Devosia sp. Leaf64]|uniref:ammonia-dependent NAD(+) synthetase n=1 Tax=Devosia sp. Leaf64 TaxID=1736229 RepID=UPI0007161A12|nr:ammonia-dependent NAD(+) synthetase [Devosia sp. Leaf64]KQN71340.1 NAD(+) synthetase [Devosia sp. Leaf64]
MSSQSDIRRDLGVSEAFDAHTELGNRVQFIKDYLQTSGLRSLVLGISGGVDSTTAGLIAQRAVRELRSAGGAARFIAVRLPYGVQADASDADAAIEAIKPDLVLEINVQPATDAMWQSLQQRGFPEAQPGRADLLRGNIKARQRMIAQFAIAAAFDGLVIGTDHAAEAAMGFFTKFGDGAADILPLSGLSKRRVRALARALGAPEHLIEKVPTADLEDLAPLRPDEEAYGVTYDEIDDFLEGQTVANRVSEVITARYRATLHKRALPAAPMRSKNA